MPYRVRIDPRPYHFEYTILYLRFFFVHECRQTFWNLENLTGVRSQHWDGESVCLIFNRVLEFFQKCTHFSSQMIHHTVFRQNLVRQKITQSIARSQFLHAHMIAVRLHMNMYVIHIYYEFTTQVRTFRDTRVIAARNEECVAACCSVLQHVAACCSMLQHVAACCSVLQYV